MKKIIVFVMLAMSLSSCMVAARTDGPGRSALVVRPVVGAVVVVPGRHVGTKHCYRNRYRVRHCYYR